MRPRVSFEGACRAVLYGVAVGVVFGLVSVGLLIRLGAGY